MALVNLLRFSPRSGGIVADEEMWNVFFRRRLHLDNLHSLLSPEQAKTWDMEVVLGAVGYPAVTREVVEGARAELARRHDAGAPPDGVREVAHVAFEALQRAVRGRIDQKMKFWFGFGHADLMRGAYSADGRDVPIKTKKVKDYALGLSDGSKADVLLKAAQDFRAAVFGFDPVYGMTAFYLSPEKSICGYVHEGFDCIGTGKYASGLSFGRDFNAKTLKMRQAGYAPAEGAYELLYASLLGLDHFKEVGGTMHLVLLDGEKKTHAERYREIFDEKARLCQEVARAAVGGFLARGDAIALLDGVLFKGKPFESVEKDLFAAASDPEALGYYLRGYKRFEAPVCAGLARGGSPKAAAPRRAGGRKK
ncbi:MAG: hypothetical protein MUC63_07305 [Planctomycetes bacterium]|nr:hypothetical protein [Planctomycetota bacterium]